MFENINTSRGINWKAISFLIAYQVLLLIALPFYFYYATFHWSMIVISVVLLYLTGFSITAGYHRLYAHKAYRVHPIIEALILFFGAMSIQGSALRWCYDHRLHHANVDTDDDPYDINKGFWYAHFLWIVEKPRQIEPKVVPDLMKNKLVMFQHRHIDICMIGSNVITFLVVGVFLGDFLGALALAVGLRLFALHHFTWFINSLAHTWGDKPFSLEHTAVNNYVISILTFGEGYHNYHHTFANDYRNGVRWYQFDPTKWLIWTLHKLGLAKDLKRMSPYAIKKKMVMEHKNLLIEQIKSYWNTATDEMEKHVTDVADRIVLQISEFSQLKEQYKQVKSTKPSRDVLKGLRQEIRAARKSLRTDWKKWAALSRSILYRRPVPQT